MPSLPFRTTAGTSDGLSGSSRQSEVRRSNWALTATTIVLRDIKTAPTAGWRSIPHGASTPAARGGGFLDDTGRAVGVLTASEHSGDNLVVSLADVVAFARAHGVAGLHVVRGHDAFSGSAIL